MSSQNSVSVVYFNKDDCILTVWLYDEHSVFWCIFFVIVWFFLWEDFWDNECVLNQGVITSENIKYNVYESDKA